MENEVITALTATFEGHAQTTEDGIEYWLARDLQFLLGYAKWDNFLNVVIKAKTACEISSHEVRDHFADVGKMVELGSGSKREVPDIMLPRITIHNAREHSMNKESEISLEHFTNNRAVRDTLLSRGIRPESLSPSEDIKKVERRIGSEDKKALGKPDSLAGDDEQP
ncbi:MAG: hypothetical protein A2Y38_24285 [Spirochaetes bacterium GWB1_59_5]|nr:MAG: hypothetical protein A2Y38_24285 [Spirochaetes bacterium GWB1_59_5]